MVRIWAAGLFLSLFAASAVAGDVELIYERGDKATDLQVELQLTEATLFERGQVIILYKVETRHPALHLRFGNLNIDNAVSYRIPLSSEPIGDNRYRHYFGWTVHPLKSGGYTVHIPDVAYYRGGNINYRIKGRDIHLEVSPVPDYIPRQLPVGSYSMQLQAPSFWLLQGSEVYFDLFINTDGVADAITRPNPPEILKAYQASQSIQLNSIDEKLDRHGLHTRYHYLVPVKINRSGLISSEAKLQWFDPGLQKLQSQIVEAPWVVLLNGWQLFIIVALILALSTYLVKHGIANSLHYLRRVVGYHRLQSQLDNIQSVQGLREAITYIAIAEGMLYNKPVAQLLEKIPVTGPEQQRQYLIESVNHALYGNGDLPEVITGLQLLARSRMGIMRFITRNRPVLPENA